MGGRWINVKGEDLYEVDQLSGEGLYGRYSGRSGQGVVVNISNLRENLPLNETPCINSRLSNENFSPGSHTISYQGVGAVFRNEEKSTVGGFVADVTLNVEVGQNGTITVKG
ncbi:hypothetical protein AB1M95_03045 [Sulfitobacter sp. LCG007]